MKFKYGLVTAGCLVAMGLAGTAQAVQVAGELLDVYGNFYPQYQISSFADGATGTQQSPMTAGLNTPATATTAPTKANITQVNWVNSYLGFKGQKAFGDITAGYDFQGVVMSNGTLATETNAIGAARDAFVFVAHKKFGTLQFGQMDTIYKEFGDRVRLLGTSSSNFTSTSGIVSGVTWKAPTANAAGTTSFNTRINGQVRWISPNWSGVEVGVSIRPDPARTTTTDASLSAMGIRWSNPKYYVGLAQEVHNDYRTMSGTNAADVGTNIFSVAPRSKDTATRLSFGYTAEKYKLGADFSNLKYTEDATIAGNFSSYETTGWQVSGEYSVNNEVTVGGNYGKNAAGSCSLLGVATCSTDGLGGSMMSLGARYDYDKNIGFFALYGKSMVNSAAVLASGNVGGDVTNVALGLQVKF